MRTRIHRVQKRIYPTRSVYLLANGPDGSFKIGCSAFPRFRRKVLSASTECKLELIAAVESDKPFKLEKYLHRAFAHLRVQGEWFALTEKEVRLFKRIRGLDDMPATVAKLHEKNRVHRKRFAVLNVSAGVLSDLRLIATFEGKKTAQVIDELVGPIIARRAYEVITAKLADLGGES